MNSSDLSQYQILLNKLKGQRDSISQKIQSWSNLAGNTTNSDTPDSLNNLTLRNASTSLHHLQQNLGDLSQISDLKKTGLTDVDKIFHLQNNQLNQNLHNFSQTQNDINTRSRLAQINQDSFIQKSKTTHALSVFAFLALGFILLISSWKAGLISFLTTSWIFIVAMSLYLAYLIYWLNLFKAQTITKAAITDFDILARDVKNGVFVLRGDINNALFGKQIPCPTCPPTNSTTNSNPPSNLLPSNDPDGAIIHNDNTTWFTTSASPPQKIVPLDDSMIDWEVKPNGQIPSPTWDVRPNSCLLNWNKRQLTELPKPSYGDPNNDNGSCVPTSMPTN